VNRPSSFAPTYNPLEWLLAPLFGPRTDLTDIRRATEALRDRPALLRSYLSVLLRDPDALIVVADRSRIHANGFAKVVLSQGPEWSLRLHVWTPWICPESDDVNPHGHRWSFASWIITGTLRETMFDVVRHGRPFHRYDYCGENGELRQTGTARLAGVDEVHRVAGTVYQLEGSELHAAAPCTDLVATLVLHGESGRPPRSFDPPGSPGMRTTGRCPSTTCGRSSTRSWQRCGDPPPRCPRRP
jgi:hypothetical protein